MSNNQETNAETLAVEVQRLRAALDEVVQENARLRTIIEIVKRAKHMKKEHPVIWARCKAVLERQPSAELRSKPPNQVA